MAREGTATITYEVPHIKGSYTPLDRYGEFDGNVLLTAVLTGDGPTVNTFLAEFAEEMNKRFDQADARANFTAKILEAVPDVISTVTLTGFKAFANTDPKTKYRKPKLVNEGEGCGSGYCDLAGKFRFPDAPEGLDWKPYTLACQKHAVEAVEARATFVAQGGDVRRYHYLNSDQHSQIKDTIREDLKNIKA